jgi:hypothetical protein
LPCRREAKPTTPWWDYLAFPVAPFLLLVQSGALFIRRTRWRWGINVTCVVAIAAMLVYVGSVSPEEDQRAPVGAEIGTSLLSFWLAMAVVLLAIGVVREVVARLRGGRSRG